MELPAFPADTFSVVKYDAVPECVSLNTHSIQNGDRIDAESCKNVLIENSTFDVGYNGICIKSGKDEYGGNRGIPAEDMLIRNNTVYKGHGGLVVGSVMSGSACNIFVRDCTFIGTDKGIDFIKADKNNTNLIIK